MSHCSILFVWLIWILDTYSRPDSPGLSHGHHFIIHSPIELPSLNKHGFNVSIAAAITADNKSSNRLLTTAPQPEAQKCYGGFY